MEIEKLNNGFVKLSAPNGVKDKRNGQVYSEVVVKEINVKNFVENE